MERSEINKLLLKLILHRYFWHVYPKNHLNKTKTVSVLAFKYVISKGQFLREIYFEAHVSSSTDARTLATERQKCLAIKHIYLLLRVPLTTKLTKKMST